jgi:hypothetical protein
MAVNANKPERWKSDIIQSVDFYNKWFMDFAPVTFRKARAQITSQVSDAIRNSTDLTTLTPDMLRAYPRTLAMLRMATAPPIARDRLSGLSYVNRSVVNRMEIDGKIPRLTEEKLQEIFSRMLAVISQLLDHDIFPWLAAGNTPTDAERERAATIVADRLSGATADPIVRNAQEQRQLNTIKSYLESKNYQEAKLIPRQLLQEMKPGTFTFRQNVIVGSERQVNIPIDVIVQPHNPKPGKLPILIEAKSAGDFTNTNKRRKEEATKMRQLRETFGENITFILFLNGYFDSGYLGYEAAERIDWVWEHRITDLEDLGI